MMQRWQQLLPLLCLTAALGMDTLGNTAKAADGLLSEVKNRTGESLHVIPLCDNSSSTTKLVIEGKLIALTEDDRQALASCPALLELHLDGNQVTEVPAHFFSVVPQLRVLSLSRNNISRLDPEAFLGLDVLTELDLSHNLLTHFPTQLLRGLKNLKVLNLQENPWKCSSSLLHSIREITAANITVEDQDGDEAAAVSSTSPSHTSTELKTMLPANQDQTTSSDKPERGQNPVFGNTWKFTACVAALAITISMLIVGAIKGPSWYKQFHNYQHRRLDDEEEEGEGVVSTVFSETGTYVQHQTFVFEEEDGQIEMEEKEEEDEDGYFEDPYIKRDE